MKPSTDAVWAPVALADARRRLEEWIDCHAADLLMPFGDFIDRMLALSAEEKRLLAGGLAIRPPRRMPALKALAAYHGMGSDPHCFVCGYGRGGDWVSAGSWLDRAHVIDRFLGGLDGPQNLRPLCRLCHNIQPVFEPGQEAEALTWFGEGFPDEAVDAAEYQLVRR